MKIRVLITILIFYNISFGQDRNNTIKEISDIDVIINEIISISKIGKDENNDQIYSLFLKMDEINSYSKNNKKSNNSFKELLKIKAELSNYYLIKGNLSVLANDIYIKREAVNNYRKSYVLSNDKKTLEKINRLKEETAYKVYINLENEAKDLKINNTFKKDVLFYLNKKYDFYIFNLDKNSKNDYVIDLNINNFNVNNIVYNNANRSVVNFISDLRLLNNQNIEIKRMTNSYLISNNEIFKNGILLVNERLVSEFDNNFLDYIKPNYFVNEQAIGFTFGSPENSENIKTKNLENRNKFNVFAILLSELDKLITPNK